MLMLYFSGTGNSRYVAEAFSRRVGAECHSIEEAADFAARMAAHTEVAVCYPVYCSGVPRPMREFAIRYQGAFQGKQVLIFCTQMLYSGDGARAFTDLFPPGLVHRPVCRAFFYAGQPVQCDACLDIWGEIRPPLRRKGRRKNRADLPEFGARAAGAPADLAGRPACWALCSGSIFPPRKTRRGTR